MTDKEILDQLKDKAKEAKEWASKCFQHQKDLNQADIEFNRVQQEIYALAERLGKESSHD